MFFFVFFCLYVKHFCSVRSESENARRRFGGVDGDMTVDLKVVVVSPTVIVVS